VDGCEKDELKTHLAGSDIRFSVASAAAAAARSSRRLLSLMMPYPGVHR